MTLVIISDYSNMCFFFFLFLGIADNHWHVNANGSGLSIQAAKYIVIWEFEV